MIYKKHFVYNEVVTDLEIMAKGPPGGSAE